MLIRYIFKNIRRSVLTNALFCLLLALAGALLALSAGLWFSVYKTEKNLDEMITTIALPDVYAIRRHAKNLIDSGLITEIKTSWGETITREEDTVSFLRYATSENVQNNIINDIAEKVYDSGLLQMDDRRMYGAYSAGLRSVPYRITEEMTYDEFVEQSPQSIAAFVVYCKGIEEVFLMRFEGGSRCLQRAFVARFEVERDIYLHNGHRETKTMTGYIPWTNPDGSFPVEEGKRYIVMGYQYSQGGNASKDNPGWYYALPSDKNMPNALYMDIIGSNYEIVETSVIKERYEFHEDIRHLLARYYITEESLPMSVRDGIPKYDPDLGYEGYTWFELNGNLEEALDSPQGRFISEALSVAEISYNSLELLTTNDINSLLRFNQRTNKITAGRAFNRSEIENGAGVCVISEQLAELNGLSVGDVLPLQMYRIKLGQLPVRGAYAWIPSAYHPKLELTGTVEFRIVGIYSGLIQEMNDYAISPNTIIVPGPSFDGRGLGDAHSESSSYFTGRGLYSYYDAPLLNTIIVPNGEIEEAKTVIDGIAPDFSGLFRFYDQGYSTLKPVLANLMFGMTWILVLAAAGWIIAVVIFSLFYIGRKRREVALLNGLGVSKLKSSLWVFIQCAVVVTIAQAIVLAAVLPVFSDILDSAVSISRVFTEAYRNFTLSDMNIAGGIRFLLPLDRSPFGLILAVAGKAALMLIISGILSAKAALRRWASREEAG